jgi:hypothetical protein
MKNNLSLIFLIFTLGFSEMTKADPVMIVSDVYCNIWAAGRKNDAKYISTSHEYILVYARNIQSLNTNIGLWRKKKDGLEEIYKCMERLAKTHPQHLECYGKGNRARLTGLHETGSYDRFSFGVGTRNTSIRIPNQTFADKCGYFEDRRPAANMDPYVVTSAIYKTCCIHSS